MQTIWRGSVLAVGTALLSACSSVPGTEATQATVSAVHLNQTGFRPDTSKRAIVVTDADAPLQWRLLDAEGDVRARGLTTPFGLNSGSQRNVHQIDFSHVDTEGAGYTLHVSDTVSHPFDIARTLYSTLKYDALAFFYHQRVSAPIEAQYVGERWARPVAHAPDSATCPGPNDHRGNAWGGCPYTIDASRGWYDAGDQGKYLVPGGVALWTLQNYYERIRGDAERRAEFADGSMRIPERANGIDDLLDEIRWELDFLLAMQVPEGTTLRLPRGDQRRTPDSLRFTSVDASGMVHHKIADESWTGLPTPPHLDRETRWLAYPNTASTLNLAAVAAQCSRIWRGSDDAFAERCLSAARRAYDAAERLPDVFAYEVTAGGSGGYGDSTFSDEFYWAAVELYLATGEERFATAMRASPHWLANTEFNWSTLPTLGTISLATAGEGADRDSARASIVERADVYRGETAAEGYAIPFGRRYVWGSNSDFSNRAMVLALAHDFTGDERYRTEVVNAMDYILGRNPMDQSYVAGYGERPLLNPHHRFWAHSLDASLPPPPPGTLGGGSNNSRPADPIAESIYANCQPQTCYADDIGAYSLNEVAINWNAPFFWIAAWLDE